MARGSRDIAVYPAGVPGVTARHLRLRSGLRVRVVETGPATGEPVVLIPGWGCSAYLYRHNLPALADAGFRASVVELSGQGWSDKPSDAGAYTLRGLSAQALEAIDALELECPSIVGQSMGGAVVLRVAREAPARVARLALFAPAAVGRVRWTALARRVPVAAASTTPRPIRRALVGVALHVTYGALARPTARDVEQYFAPDGDPAYGRAMLTTLRQFDWSTLDAAALARITVPMLVVYGTRDRIISTRGVEERLRSAPDARLIVVPGAGHAVNEEAPEVANRALVDFLKGVAPSTGTP